jgi:hypothetical protein
MVKTFLYSPDIVETLKNAFPGSPVHLSGRNGHAGDGPSPLCLEHCCQCRFLWTVAGVGVALRNAFHQALVPVYGLHWYDNPLAGLTPVACARIAEAKQKLQGNGKPITPPRVVAELSFGFWERLLSRGPGGNRNYEVTLWRPALHRAFPYAHRPRTEVHRPLPGLRDLRNRIAHHEPIFAHDLAADYRTILDVIGWMCPDTRDWVAYQSKVPAIFAARP